MKAYLVSTGYLLLLLALVSCTAALSVVSIPIAKRDGPLLRARADWRKRATILETLVNNITEAFYSAKISIGTPPQDIVVQIDTGSSDTYAMASTASACQDGSCIGGTFDSTQSSTFKVVDKNGFDITYQDKSGSSGDYISDTLAISTATLTAVEMGLAYYTTVGYGLMGLGYDNNEASATSYPNVIDQLVTQGQINARAYSLYLDDIEASTGSLLFGGIDQAKFDGQLQILAVQPSPEVGAIIEFLVPVDAISFTDQSGKTTSLLSAPITAVLDSGTYLTYLPAGLVQTLVTYFSAFDDTANSGVIFADCALISSQSNVVLSYTFGSATIKVAITELISRFESPPSGTPFSDPCLLGILPVGQDSPYIFGDTFLRSAYVVYDIDNNQVGIAPSNFDSASSKLYEIPKGASAIPPLAGSGPTSASPSNAAPSSLPPSSAASSSATPSSAAPSSTAPSSAPPSSTTPSSAAPSSTAQSSAAPSSTFTFEPSISISTTFTPLSTNTPVILNATDIITNTNPTTLSPTLVFTAATSSSQTPAVVSSSEAMGRVHPVSVVALFMPTILALVVFVLAF